jgi:RNA recognition motif-containing protein
MTIKLYVGNVSYSMTDEELGELFRKFGEVQTANIIKDKATSKSRGFGFVEMTNREQGEAAIKELNGKTIKERAIVVNEAYARAPRPRGGSGPRGNRRKSE